MKLLLENWRKFLKEEVALKPDRNGLYLFDFDDTLAVTSCRIEVTYKDGSTERLPTEEFEKQRKELEKAKENEEISYEEFCHLGEEEEFDYLPEMENFKRLINDVIKQGTYMENEVAILTARQPEIETPLKNKLEKEQGIPSASYKIFGVSGGGAPKANKVRELLDTGKYDYVYFVDDSLNNLNAVSEVVEEYNIEFQYKLAS